MSKGKVKSLLSLNNNDVQSAQTYIFDGLEPMEDEKGKGKDVWTFASEKGAGKTTAILAFQELYGGEMLCFSYDGKTQKIKHKYHKGNENIHVKDIRKHFVRTPEKRLESGSRCIDMIMYELTRIDDNSVDWVFHDYVDLLPVLVEMKCRKIHNKMAKQPVSGYDQMWKDRKAIIQDIHSTSLRKAKYGVFYAGYTVRENIMKDGEVLTTGPRKPHWNDIIEVETDVTVIVEIEEEILKNGRVHRRLFYIDNSKVDYPEDRTWYSVNTNAELDAFVKGNGIVINRAPPKSFSLPPISKSKEDDTITDPVKVKEKQAELLGRKTPKRLI